MKAVDEGTVGGERDVTDSRESEKEKVLREGRRRSSCCCGRGKWRGVCKASLVSSWHRNISWTLSSFTEPISTNILIPNYASSVT